MRLLLLLNFVILLCVQLSKSENIKILRDIDMSTRSIINVSSITFSDGKTMFTAPSISTPIAIFSSGSFIGRVSTINFVSGFNIAVDKTSVTIESPNKDKGVFVQSLEADGNMYILNLYGFE